MGEPDVVYSYQKDATQEIISALVYLLLAILALGLFFYHAKNLYSDLYTPGRKVVDYRREKPKIKGAPGYVRMSWLTFISITGFTLTLFFGAISRNFSSTGRCAVLSLLSLLAWMTGKSFMYITFLLRIHTIYGDSKYAYDIRKLKAGAIAVGVVSCLLSFGWIYIAFNSYVDIEDHPNAGWPYYCESDIADQGDAVFISVLTILFDIILGIATTVAFMKPFDRLREDCNKRCQEIEKEHREKRYAKMLYTGCKYQLLAVCSAVSTAIWLILAIAGGAKTESGQYMYTLAEIWGAFDFIVHIVALMLMTTYYPDNIFYERVCRCCIKLCPFKNPLLPYPRYKSHASDPHKREKHGHGEWESVDTVDAICKTAKNKNDGGAASNDARTYSGAASSDTSPNPQQNEDTAKNEDIGKDDIQIQMIEEQQP